MLTLALAGQINAIDSSGAVNVVNVDLRQQPNAGGFFAVEVTASGVSAGSVSVSGQLAVIDAEGGGLGSVVNVDLRQQPNAGGFLNAEVLSSLLSYVGATAPLAPTTSTATSGALAARTEYFKATYLDANGNESLASPVSIQAMLVSTVPTVTSPAASTGATKYNVYGGATAGTETLQNATPINLGTGWQEPDTGLISTGRAIPTANKFVTGACSVVVSQGGALAPGACVITVKQ